MVRDGVGCGDVAACVCPVVGDSWGGCGFCSFFACLSGIQLGSKTEHPWQVTKTEWVARRPRHPDTPVRNPRVCKGAAVQGVAEQVSGQSPRPDVLQCHGSWWEGFCGEADRCCGTAFILCPLPVPGACDGTLCACFPVPPCSRLASGLHTSHAAPRLSAPPRLASGWPPFAQEPCSSQPCFALI